MAEAFRAVQRIIGAPAIAVSVIEDTAQDDTRV